MVHIIAAISIVVIAIISKFVIYKYNESWRVTHFEQIKEHIRFFGDDNAVFFKGHSFCQNATSVIFWAGVLYVVVSFLNFIL